ncbi:hypothetical protein O9992_25600 [Vibrio lentus]|nr:hypothetical protein [Vibrio lentus]
MVLKSTHMLMGPIFIISVYHTFFSDVPFSLTSVTGITLANGFRYRHCAGSTKSSLRSEISAPTRLVRDIKPIDNAIEVTLAAESKTIDYQQDNLLYLDF